MMSFMGYANDVKNESVNVDSSLALQQLFPIQILLIFLRFEPPPNFLFQCYRPQTWQLPFTVKLH